MGGWGARVDGSGSPVLGALAAGVCSQKQCDHAVYAGKQTMLVVLFLSARIKNTFRMIVIGKRVANLLEKLQIPIHCRR